MLASRRRLVLVLAVLAATAPWLAGARAPAADRAGDLQTGIERQREQERSLANAAARLGRLERATAREVALLERRVTVARGELDRAVALERRAADRLGEARRRVRRLRARLGEVRTKLATLLASRYRTERPDLMTVVLNADGFAALLETMDRLQRVERSDTDLLALVTDARADAGREQRSLVALTRRRSVAADAVRARHDALAGIAAGLSERRALLGRARAARLASLRSTHSDRVRAERELSRLLAARQRAANQVGPGGPWAIPWPIVQCESGGQNTPPNSAGASGYYQMMPATWAGLGGSTPHAYLASKAEQDRLATKLWAGGSGARNWVCASLVGVI